MEQAAPSVVAEINSIKVVTVGEAAVGKTCLLITYTSGSFPEEYVPTVFDNYSTSVMVRDKPVDLSLWDTAGNEESDRLRPLAYPKTDVFLTVFSAVEPESLRSIKKTFIPEIQSHCPGVPFVLVGTKIDLRKDREIKQRLRKKSLKPITKEKGVEWANHLGAAAYVECSAKTSKGIKGVFDKAVEVVVLKKDEEARRAAQGSPGCCIIL